MYLTNPDYIVYEKSPTLFRAEIFSGRQVFIPLLFLIAFGWAGIIRYFIILLAIAVLSYKMKLILDAGRNYATIKHTVLGFTVWSRELDLSNITRMEIRELPNPEAGHHYKLFFVGNGKDFSITARNSYPALFTIGEDIENFFIGKIRVLTRFEPNHFSDT